MFFKKILCLIAVLSLFLFPVAGFSEKAGMSSIKPDTVYQKAVPGEAQVLKRLNARYGWEFAKRLSRISGNTEGAGFRYAGTPAGSEASKLVSGRYLFYKKFFWKHPQWRDVLDR